MSVFQVIVELGDKLSDLVMDQSEWSQVTFGDDKTRGPLGPLRHLEKEAKEAQKNPTDKMEYADCLLLVLDAARRAGIKPMQLIEAAQEKMKINRSRVWPKQDEWVFEKPHFVDSEDCMGVKVQYWRVWAKRGETLACGVGATKEQALEDCRKRTTEYPVQHKE